MRTAWLALLFAFLFTTANAQSVEFDWANPVGGFEQEAVYAVEADSFGNAYSTGNYWDTLDFNPNGQPYFLNGNGAHDAFVQKIDSAGNLIWAKTFGGTSVDYGTDLTLDKYGDVYCVGRFQDTADFDPGTAVLPFVSNGNEDAFIVKLDSAGDLLWAASFGGINDDRIVSVTTDLSGNVYVSGIYHDTVDFDPGPSNFNMTAIASEGDVFIVKLDANGAFIWAKSIGGYQFTEAVTTVETDTSGNVYVVGYYQGTVDFDPGPGTFNMSAGGGVSIETYILKLDSNGSFMWAISLEGMCFAMCIDKVGNLLLTGRFGGTVDFDIGPAVNAITAFGNNDIYILKLDSNANFIWAKGVGGSDYDAGFGISTDDSDDVYVTGFFRYGCDFDPGPGATILVATDLSQTDAFVLKLDSSGDYSWARSYGGAGGDLGYDVAVDLQNNVFVAGLHSDTADLNPGPGVHTAIAGFFEDLHIVKLKACTPSTSTEVITSCNTYTWIDGITYTQSNDSASFVLTSITGCDSIVNLDLTINSSDTVTDVISSCDPVVWMDGNTYSTNNNTATYTLTNSIGCDSVILLDLTINTSSAIDVVTACDSFTWIDGITYTSSNSSASVTLVNSLGCDSIVTLNLTIIGVPTGVTTSGFNLIAVASGATFQWIDCADMSEISGETDWIFTATANGDYAVIVTYNGCSDTSECYTVTGIGIAENRQNLSFILAPNPTKDGFTLNFEAAISEAQIILFDITGKQVYSTYFTGGKIASIDAGPLSSGIYFVEVVHNGVRQRERLIKTY